MCGWAPKCRGRAAPEGVARIDRLKLANRFLIFFPNSNALVADNLPACTKYAQAIQGIPAGQPRAPMPPASPAQQQAIQTALRALS